MTTRRLGIDVGGTFTDVLLHDAADGSVRLLKTATTTGDQSRGVVSGLSEICRRAGIGPEQLGAIMHGTTAATNAVLEGRGAKVGVIVNEGFRHLFHLAEAWTPGPLFGFMVYDRPAPLVGVELMAEVRGRMGAGGEEVEPLDEASVEAAVAQLVAAGAEAVTVCLLSSYANPDHERAVGAIVARVAPGLPVSLSADVLAEFREYERAVTTTMNAYVAPEMDRYLRGLRDGLDAVRAGAELQVVRSDGGLMSLDAARATPVHTMLSGPAGGVSGAAHVARLAGHERIITFDMGGTSTDVSASLDGRPQITRETKVGAFPMRVPSVAVETIGAGGGSIASVSEVTGGLRVGPESAGAVPGPACYGNGGTEATVTDANVVLGHLPPRLLGGAMTLDVDAAHAAVARVGEQLGLGVPETAQAIVRLVDENMLGALRLVTVQRGMSADTFALVPFGGAGALHANALAATLGCFPVIVPLEPGVLSALGFLVSDVRSEFSRTFIRAVADVAPGEIADRLRALGEEAAAFLDREGVAAADREVRYAADMRYHRQGYELPIAIDDLEELTLAQLGDAFTATHEQLYGFGLPGGAELVTLRAVGIGRVPAIEMPARPLGPPDAAAARTGTHPVWDGSGFRDVPTYDRDRLAPGMVLDGPAIVEQYDATTLVLAGHVAAVDQHANLLITPGGTA
ncbi:hydantoinase/oxoprolinase family protein [Capillimicrobium parvum]|uniref:Acetophenone carboxylase gamma subunit n=1 Tax=Capillimicrobium parvum TaxID=2884022 RepID=A0A9E6XUP3_9ACTN|nr:hydantoinase/oxoprolinase family protein [Capillimicrobium parvum]UGS34736.1 Acetophenone carboxylase gamma subunit [Capillimicrobium parvum]